MSVVHHFTLYILNIRILSIDTLAFQKLLQLSTVRLRSEHHSILSTAHYCSVCLSCLLEANQRTGEWKLTDQRTVEWNQRIILPVSENQRTNELVSRKQRTDKPESENKQTHELVSEVSENQRINESVSKN